MTLDVGALMCECGVEVFRQDSPGEVRREEKLLAVDADGGWARDIRRGGELHVRKAEAAGELNPEGIELSAAWQGCGAAVETRGADNAQEKARDEEYERDEIKHSKGDEQNTGKPQGFAEDSGCRGDGDVGVR